MNFLIPTKGSHTVSITTLDFTTQKLIDPTISIIAAWIKIPPIIKIINIIIFMILFIIDKFIKHITNTIIDNLPSIIVDMGAVPYVCDGANIMAPGILRISDDFSKNEIVVIRDTNFKKALAVGKGLASSDDINKIKKGKVIQNLHYVGDKIWRLL